MSDAARAGRPFLELPSGFESLRRAVQQDGRQSAPAQVAIAQLREQLDACRAAASTVYSHLQEHGISVNIEFQLRQMRQRILRVKALLLCLETDAPAQATAQLLSHLVKVSQDSASMRALWSSSTELLAAKVTERNAETGQHYITRNAAEYGAMLARAAGGGALLAGTTWAKLAIGALGLSSFWGGWWAGVNYALSFVLIMLLHWTVATKQPAMTAPAMAARLKDMATPGAVERFVDEVVYLLRSQFAAILGNVGLVMPVVVLLSMGLHRLGWAQRIMDPFHAQYILAQHNVLGPTALFAAATGVLLFASSLIAGWVENWFVFNRLDSALAHHPRATAALGRERAARWAAYWRQNISSWTANISLGLMLGLVPPVLRFFGIPFDVRHVTLVAGQIAAAVHELGAGALHQPALAWAAGGIVSKRDLMEAVYQRVLGADGRRSSYLDKLEREAGGAPLSVTRIVETFIESTLRLSRKDNVSGAVFKQLIGRAYFEPGDDFIPDEYVQIMDRYRGALMRALPDLDEAEVMRRMYYFIGIVAYVMAGRDVMHLLGRCAPADANDPERLLRALVPFIVGGMQAPAPR